MRTLFSLVVLLFSITSWSQETVYAPGRLLLTFNNRAKHQEPSAERPYTGIAIADSLNKTYGCKSMHAIKRSKEGYGGVYVLDIDKHADIQRVAEVYLATGYFKSVSPDYIGSLQGSIPNDTLFGKQWSLNNDGSLTEVASKAGADIDMLRAWDIEEGDPSVIVAVIDAGIKYDHPEFQGRLWKNINDIPYNNIDDDNNGYVDDTMGWDFYVGQPDIIDSNGHGTHVSGIIGANTNNITGYAGIDHHCKLMVCKMTNNQGLFNYAWIIEAIYYAADMGANVINISAGGYMNIPELQDAITYAYNKNITVVVAMGNNGSKSKFYPAACEHVIAVGATNALDTVSYFSNYGNHISVVAPGEYIHGLSNLSDTAAHIWYNGTSQATPHVTGIASLLLAQNKSRTPDEIKALIENNAEDMVGSNRDKPGWDEYYGHGRVNAYRALVNEALAIKEKVNNNAVKVFPNPAKDRVFIRCSQPMIITLTNINGQIVYEKQLAGQGIIELHSYSKGIYLLSAIAKESKYIEKLVIE